MKLTIDRSTFLKSWGMAEKVVNPKSTIEAMKGVLVDARGDQCKLVASDLKTGVELIAGGVTITEPGLEVLPASNIGNLLKKVSDDTVDITINEGRGTLKAGKNRYKFTCIPSDGYPQLPSHESAKLWFTTSRDELIQAVTEGSISCSPKDDFPKYLSAVYFKGMGDKVDICSTDGRRLSLTHIATDTGDKTEKLIPVTAAKDMIKFLHGADKDTPVEVKYDANIVYVVSGESSINMRSVEATFPNYERIMNPSLKTFVECDKFDLIKSLERISIFAGLGNQGIFKLSPNEDLSIHAKSPENGEGMEIVPLTVKGDPITLMLNMGYLLDGLKGFDAQDIKIGLAGPDAQVMLTSDHSKLLYMLMPMKMKPSDLEDLDMV